MLSAEIRDLSPVYKGRGRELVRIQEPTGISVVLARHSIREGVPPSDRIVVMTPRPGRIGRILGNPLPLPRRKT
ncbi:hypothetical protein ATO3_18825 [Marinibacterium profundimaris]|uniref:Uncharacterized protein n=2 Tax=Marinibacterium profundimaris TaxID=1679460 RepID=A0A225NIH6_9RHOB|nr:hypothetical protein ATO3_18825 [Marinibacterium profundimaris]